MPVWVGVGVVTGTVEELLVAVVVVGVGVADATDVGPLDESPPDVTPTQT